MPTNVRFTLLPIAIAQLLAGYIPPRFNLGTDIATRVTQDGIPPELPPGRFFAIWGIIFTAYFVVSLYALAKKNELVQRLSFPLMVAGLTNTVWMLAAQFIGSTLLETLILVPLVWASWTAAKEFDGMRGLGGSGIKWTSDLLTGLLSGWSVIALSISLPRLVRDLLGQGPTDMEWVSLWLVIFPLFGLTWAFRLKISQTGWYYVAICWGVLGIIVNNWTRTGYGYFGWIALIAGLWLVYRRLSAKA